MESIASARSGVKSGALDFRAAICDTAVMSQLQQARARARAEVVAEIVESARRQVAEVGPSQLSLRAVARDLGVVSSAVYRYVASRDELLTLLIVDAYDSLGQHVEDAVAASREAPPLDRWVEACVAVRTWGIEHRHEYALLYGTPVPGYDAPGERTTTAGTRASLALLSIVRDAHADGRLDERAGPDVGVALSGDLATFRAAVDLELEDHVLVRVLAGWTQLFGLVTFELFSQTRGLTRHDEDLLRACAALTGAEIGLTR
jgi:AcrR family transcriptional regulator